MCILKKKQKSSQNGFDNSRDIEKEVRMADDWDVEIIQNQRERERHRTLGTGGLG